MPDGEGRAVRQLDQQGAQPALVPPRPGQVLEHAGLGVVEALDLEQRRGPPALVARAGPPQHQPLAAQRLQAVQLLRRWSTPWQRWCSWARA